jgi:hypothetical protein
MNLFRPSPPVAEIIKSLRDEPNRWCDGTGLTRDDDQHGSSRWIGHGIHHTWISWGQLDRTINILDRWRLRRAIKQWREL